MYLCWHGESDASEGCGSFRMVRCGVEACVKKEAFQCIYSLDRWRPDMTRQAGRAKFGSTNNGYGTYGTRQP